MLFSSLSFLFIFLPILIILYFLLPYRWYKNTLLLIASLIFYAWGEPIYVLIMLLMIAINYLFGLLIYYNKHKNIILAIGIAINLLVLFFFKYFNFFIENLNYFFFDLKTIEVVMPIGISFYIFQIISYLIDIKRGKVEVQKNPLYFGCYVAFFPQLIAGPIVRYSDIAKALQTRKFNLEQTADGFRRFCLGLGKKVILANQMAIIADKIYAPDFALNFTSAWLGTIAFALQIYYDFSGYSDMAIGLAKIFGFDLLENFNYPYISKSISEFWRRWHMSLGTWFKDYVYIPLGGNRVNKIRWIFNMFIVWALTGLWHGAAYNFIFWGLYFFIILVLEKVFLNKILVKLKGFNHLYAIFLILLGWVLFNVTTIEQLNNFIINMFSFNVLDINIFKTLDLVYLIPYFLLSLVGIFPLFNKILQKIHMNAYLGIFYDLFCLLVLIMSIILLINNTYNPFIYFRF